MVCSIALFQLLMLNWEKGGLIQLTRFGGPIQIDLSKLNPSQRCRRAIGLRSRDLEAYRVGANPIPKRDNHRGAPNQEPA